MTDDQMEWIVEQVALDNPEVSAESPVKDKFKERIDSLFGGTHVES